MSENTTEITVFYTHLRGEECKKLKELNFWAL